MTLAITEDELRARVRSATEAAAQRRADRARLRAEFAAARAVGVQLRQATRLARLDRAEADHPPPAHR